MLFKASYTLNGAVSSWFPIRPHECRLFHHLRKDSRLYSYLPVVGVTLKLYNLLPHPTVKRTSRVNAERNHS